MEQEKHQKMQMRALRLQSLARQGERRCGQRWSQQVTGLVQMQVRVLQGVWCRMESPVWLLGHRPTNCAVRQHYCRY